jgi:hypothetical protein
MSSCKSVLRTRRAPTRHRSSADAKSTRLSPSTVRNEIGVSLHGGVHPAALTSELCGLARARLKQTVRIRTSRARSATPVHAQPSPALPCSLSISCLPAGEASAVKPVSQARSRTGSEHRGSEHRRSEMKGNKNLQQHDWESERQKSRKQDRDQKTFAICGSVAGESALVRSATFGSLSRMTNRATSSPQPGVYRR